ncbi:MAG: phosphoglucosamine mutase [Paludibacter sp.]|jgi:phosphomannomutase|nr:phosphoglucosamine mutase [Paludibacter sp.]
MALIASISGIRGTIGGAPAEGLNPLSLVKFTSAFASFIHQDNTQGSRKIVVGRDARISGEMVNNIVCGTLMAAGFDVVNIGLASTPTTEIAVVNEQAAGGIIITASHNPKHWNALKLLNRNGEFLNAAQGEKVLQIAQSENFEFADVDSLGKMTERHDYNSIHIQKILELPLVDIDAVKSANFTVAIDAVNSVGGIVVPQLLNALGVKYIEKINCDPSGNFAHNPEPLPQHLTEIAEKMKSGKIDVGFVVDPDVDRLAIVCEDGSMFGEEYTLVSVADYVLQNTPGNTVSNLSSTRALRDVTAKYGGNYFASAVGEVNVVEKMKENAAIIGGEGNGGVIYPACHSGRDALVGIALFLSNLAKSKLTVSQLRGSYPNYVISKNRIDISPQTDANSLLQKLKQHYRNEQINEIDGVKIDLADGWIHLRRSNTEPIFRIYCEAATTQRADELTNEVRKVIG